MRYVVLISLIVAVFMTNLGQSHGGCKERTWQRVTKSMIHSTYSIGVALTYSKNNGGLKIAGRVYHDGCGKGAGSGAVTYIKGDWTHIRYTQEFRGSASCWKIFGGPAYPKYRSDGFAFYKNPYFPKPQSNVLDLDTSVGDGIFNEYRMNSRSNSRYMNTTNTKCSNAALQEAGLPVHKQWLSTDAIVFAGLIDSWKTASRVAISTVTSVYNELPGKTVLDLIDNHVMYYPKTLVRLVSALTQVSHGQIICLAIITVHHVTVTASLRDYIMLPSLVIFADLIVDEPTVTTSDFIGEFHLWNEIEDAILSYSDKLMGLFVDGATAGS